MQLPISPQADPNIIHICPHSDIYFQDVSSFFRFIETYFFLTFEGFAVFRMLEGRFISEDLMYT